ncbi:MAG: hypothetical protein LBF12_05275 [Christensenellaceae bacterium]|jgi:hypothetical protein|nr:hypothetical protein [Christensenellaceae bacterium]
MIDIETGTILDAEIYEQIYEDYLTGVSLESTSEDVDFEEMISKVKVQGRARHVLRSEKYLVLFLKINHTICGFMEASIVENDYMFESPHVYISNLYIDKQKTININTTEFLLNMYQKVVEWTTLHNVKYICNDINVGNKVMETLNELLGFKPYRTRYYAKL